MRRTFTHLYCLLQAGLGVTLASSLLLACGTEPDSELADAPPLTVAQGSTGTMSLGCSTAPSQCGTEQLPGDSCSHIKTSNPSLGDGVYWVRTTTGQTRVYCDMQYNGGTELCRENVEQTVTGRTRDGSATVYRMRSILRPTRSVCEIWAVRRSSDNVPFGNLYVQGGNTLTTCQALGFRHDGDIGQCEYGPRTTDCGFPSANYHRLSNSCGSCEINNGSYPQYTYQGVTNTLILSDMSGSVRTTCTTGLTPCDTSPSACGMSSTTAAAGCRHIFSVRSSAQLPVAPSGIYWLLSPTTGNPIRAYCEMRSSYSRELCSEEQGEHIGAAQDSVGYKMTSILRPDTGICEMWGIRYRTFGTPFARLVQVSGVTGDTCQELGFLGDSSLGQCSYGTSAGSCGFTEDPGFIMRNSCSGCSTNPGTYTYYVRQGTFGSTTILSNMSGSVRTHCKARL